MTEVDLRSLSDTEQQVSEHERLRAFLDQHGEMHSMTLSARDGEISTRWHITAEDAVKAAVQVAIDWKIEPPTFWQRVFGREAWPENALEEYKRRTNPQGVFGKLGRHWWF